ncbi:MAG: HAMP domain-containing histidine kinase [Candidatus Omnitrophica bacterium]|nr:HAMP domain-containing histidine kinase [Candidatus Omnitrophota bacterium]
MENKALKEQLMRSEKAINMGILSGRIAHDVKNPLAVILQSVYLMETSFSETNEETKEIADMMRTALNKITEIMNKMSSCSRLLQFEKSQENICSIIDDSFSIANGMIDAKGIDIEKLYPSEKIILNVDKTAFMHLFLNLISNSCDAINSGGKIKVKVCASGGFCLVEFEDSGIGVPKDKLSDIFTPSYAVDPSSKAMGFGLIAIDRIVEKHAGTIAIESIPEKGTKLIINIPLPK